MSFLARKRITLLALVLALGSIYAPPVIHELRVLGVLPRPQTADDAARTGGRAELTIIPGTKYCEDLHWHSSGVLVTACEGEQEDRRGWFPPLGVFDRPPAEGKGRGSLVIVDPETFTARTLRIEGYDDVFITHGIDIIDDPSFPSTPSSPGAIFIHAVNHAPASPLPEQPHLLSPEHVAHSRIEVFHHHLTSSVATHVRTIFHPLVRTPNDILALTPSDILVTNDHRHRSGFLRHVEDVVTHAWGPKTDVVRLRVDLGRKEGGVEAQVALSGLHNCNGLGRGREGEVLVADAAGGVLHLVNLLDDDDDEKANDAGHQHSSLKITKSIPTLSTIDNPSFYSSPHDSTKQGYVLAGLSKAHTLGPKAKDETFKHPVVVWFVPLLGEVDGVTQTGEPRLLWSDDGNMLSTASAAVIVDRQAGEGWESWLFVTGFMSDAVVAVRVDL